MHDRLCRLWWLLVFAATLVLGAPPGGEIEFSKSGIPFSDVPSPTQAALIALTVVVSITSVIALGCCACKLCQAKDPIVQEQHIDAIKETIQTVRDRHGDTPFTVETLAPALINKGVTYESAVEAMDNLETLEALELEEEDLELAGGKEAIAETIKHKQYISASEQRKTLPEEEKLPVTTRLDFRSEFDYYTIYQPGLEAPLADKPKRKRRRKGEDYEYYETESPSPPGSPGKQTPTQLPGMPNDIIIGASGRPKRRVKVKKKVKKSDIRLLAKQGTAQGTPEGHFAGLDVTSDFDEYTIYDQGELNEYGILKAQREKKAEEGTGLDATADFDEYTIYDQGELNEYGILKAQREKKTEVEAGLDFKADFDEYTIYDQGELNEYGILKAEREKKIEGGVGLDTAKIDFDEYTIYDLPEQNYEKVKAEITAAKKLREEEKAMQESKRPLPRIPSPPSRPLPTAPIASRPLPAPPRPLPALPTGFGPAPAITINTPYVDFDDYTIYDTGTLNIYGVLKAEREKKVEEGAGLDTKADFEEYTIYEAGELNEYGVLKAEREKKKEEGAGLDTKGDFDEYTIYDTGELNEYGVLKAEREKKKEEEVGPDTAAHDFDEYTIYQ